MPALVVVCTTAACAQGGTSITSSRTSAVATTSTLAPRSNVDGVLRIGALLPLSGDGAALGPPLLDGVNLAISEINAAGGVNGKHVELKVADEGGDPVTASAALEELVEKDGVDAVVGPVSSRVTLSLLPPLTAAGILTCSPTATSTALTAFPDNDYFFRTAPPDSLQAIALGLAISRTGGRSTGILFSNDDYGQSIADDLRQELRAQGTEVVDQVALDPSALSYRPQVLDLLGKKPAAIAFAGTTEPGVRVLSTLRDLGLPAATPVFVSDGMRHSDLIAKAGPTATAAVSGVMGTSMASVIQDSRWFNDALAASDPHVTNLYAAYAYDCTNLIALASRVSGTDDAAQMRRQMVDISTGGVLCHNYPSCVEQLEAGRANIDLDGASGQIEFGSNGDPTYGYFDVFKFDKAGRDVTSYQTSVTSA